MGRFVPRGGREKDAYTVLVGRPEGRSYLKDLGVDGARILKWFYGS